MDEDKVTLVVILSFLPALISSIASLIQAIAKWQEVQEKRRQKPPPRKFRRQPNVGGDKPSTPL